MTKADIKINWYYFRSLANQLQRTEQFVDHSLNVNGKMTNASTHSNEFAKILMLAASEFEVIAKALCLESGIMLPWNANILRITRETTKKYPLIGETIISTPYLTLQPLKEWGIIQEINRNGKLEEKVNGIPWWDAHNGIKHDRRQIFETANLENCVYAVASLLVLELFLSQKALGNVDEITLIGCDYFKCDYGLSYLEVDVGKRLPGF